MLSKNALSKELPQKQLATTSRRAPFCRFAVVLLNVSLVMGFRDGSVATPWQVSFQSDAVISLSSLCLIEGNDPLGQERACCTEKEWPHTQFVGICDGGHPYTEGQWHHGMLFCGVRIRALLAVKQ